MCAVKTPEGSREVTWTNSGTGSSESRVGSAKLPSERRQHFHKLVTKVEQITVRRAKMSYIIMHFAWSNRNEPLNLNSGATVLRTRRHSRVLRPTILTFHGSDERRFTQGSFSGVVFRHPRNELCGVVRPHLQVLAVEGVSEDPRVVLVGDDVEVRVVSHLRVSDIRLLNGAELALDGNMRRSIQVPTLLLRSHSS